MTVPSGEVGVDILVILLTRELRSCACQSTRVTIGFTAEVGCTVPIPVPRTRNDPGHGLGGIKSETTLNLGKARSSRDTSVRCERGNRRSTAEAAFGFGAAGEFEK